VARLIYTAISSVDGYVEDEHGKFDWARPDEEVHRFVNELERSAGTYLYGRRLYETMRYWETALEIADQPAEAAEFAQIWQAADKIVFSRTLDGVTTTRTRLEPVFSPALVEGLKSSLQQEITIGGAELAAEAFKANLIDEVHLLLNPVAVGAGKPSLPTSQQLHLDLVDYRRFANGVVHLHYQIVL
jgi:dihydrofolate reductase